MKPLTIDQAAKKLKVTPRRVRDFCREGRIGTRFGGCWMIDPDELKQFMKLPRKAGRPPTQ